MNNSCDDGWDDAKPERWVSRQESAHQVMLIADTGWTCPVGGEQESRILESAGGKHEAPCLNPEGGPAESGHLNALCGPRVIAQLDAHHIRINAETDVLGEDEIIAVAVGEHVAGHKLTDHRLEAAPREREWLCIGPTPGTHVMAERAKLTDVLSALVGRHQVRPLEGPTAVRYSVPLFEVDLLRHVILAGSRPLPRADMVRPQVHRAAELSTATRHGSARKIVS